MKKIQSERYHKSKIMLWVMIFIIPLFIGLASAEEVFKFDNRVDYNTLTQTATIVNTLGFRTLADIKLNTPLVNVLPIGYQKVAEFELRNYEDYTSAFEKMEFYNVKDNMKSIERQFDYKVKGIESYIVNDWDMVCEAENKSCEFKIIGNHTAYREVWIPLEKYDFKAGDILTIGIYTYVYEWDNVEWIPTFYGKQINEWASFVQSSGTITTDGLYTVHTFTSNGTFNISSGNTLNVSVLIVGGGGGGGSNEGTGNGGGGGAGGLIFNNSEILSSGSYSVVVGIGGTSGTSLYGGNGTQTSFNGIIAYGGGGGGYYMGAGAGISGLAGGSGGGAGQSIGGTPAGGLGIVGQGNNGGNGGDNKNVGAGGGGAGTVGQSTTITDVAGNGGNGTTSTIYNGTALYYAGGGGGGAGNPVGAYAGVGGLGGGGKGANSSQVATAGINGTGGGGGAGGNDKGGKQGGTGIVIIRYLTSEAEGKSPSVTLNSPTENQNFTNPIITFNASVFTYYDIIKISNVTLYIDGVLNQTDTSEVNGTYIFTKTLSDGNHNWSILAYSNNSENNQSETRNFTIDTTTPTLEVFSPTNTTYLLNNFVTINNYTIFLNWSSNDTHLDKCWYSKDDGTTNTTVTCSDNTTTLFETTGNYTYKFWVNDTFGNINSSSVTFTIDYKLFDNGRTSNGIAYETDVESYTINISANSSLTNVWLNYNNTYTPAVQSGTNWTVTKVLSSVHLGNITFNWTAQYAGLNITSSNNYQQVNAISFFYCNQTYDEYINLTFKDEGNESRIPAKVPSSTFVYYLGNGTINKTYLYTSAVEYDNYTFCFTPNNKTVYVDYDFQYSGTSYPQRIYSSGLVTYTNQTTNKSLYLLGSASGLYVTFQVVDGSDTPIQNVYVNASRTISGSIVVIGEGLTGSDGGITFWLNPDFQHTVKFSKTGYDDYTTTLYPTQSLYTVQLGATTTTSTDYTNGVEIWITPSKFTLNNNTVYNFSSRIKSTYWSITNFGYNLKNSTGFYIYNTSAATNGGLLQQDIDTKLNTTLIMEFYYVVNATYTNYTYIWTIQNTLGDDWSIKTFGNDLKTYLGSGMFGLTNFGLSLIIFFIIILGTGIMSYKFGFSSPAAITGVVFGIVFILDFGLGLMDNLNPISAVSHTPTLFVGLVLIVFIIREVMSNQ